MKIKTVMRSNVFCTLARKTNGKWIPFLLLLLTFSIIACDNHPDNILSHKKMEDVLYDYHLMQGLIDQLPMEERKEKTQDYVNAVFEKHGITEAQFDSSIVYYNRNTRELYKIYSNLKKRYTAENEELQLVNGNNDMMAVYAEGGDTTNLWNSVPLIVLRNKEILNKESFTIHADTSFHRHDQFILTLSPTFIKEANDDRDISLHVGISIMYSNGKTIGTTRQIYNNGTQQLTVKATNDDDIKQVTGFFYYRGKTSMRNLCLIDHITLVKMHEKAEEKIEMADSIMTDSLDSDTILKPVERRLTPEEVRKKNMSDEHIKIQMAPSVRTPNSIGPRRQTKKPPMKK
ncbi:MAG: DUF4296 domain-containing protein [Bacteroidaceae bacterium]|nr:DUF4296 domain-containing protein [Bacteroidaceae bacterium]